MTGPVETGPDRAAHAVAATLAAAYEHGAGKSVTADGGVVPAARQVRPRGLDLRELARTGPFGSAVRRALGLALAPRRWEPWNPNNDHRAYPSPRSAWLHDAVLRAGEHRWRLDPVRLLLEGADQETVAEALRRPVSVELLPAAERLPAGYGALRDALTLLEVGHVTAALVEAAGAVGLRAEARCRPDPDAGAAVAEVLLRPGERPTWPLERVRAERSSGLGPRGLSADPRPLPADLLRGFVGAACAVPAGSLAADGAGGRLRHRLVLHAVAGHADGVYQPDPGDQAVRRLAGHPAASATRLRFGPERVDLTGINVAWLITADVAAMVRDLGPAGYQRLLLAAGAAAQHVCSAAAVTGLFCRPMRDFDEAAAEAATGAAAGQDALYLLVAGRPRVHDFSYDLTDPEVLP